MNLDLLATRWYWTERERRASPPESYDYSRNVPGKRYFMSLQQYRVALMFGLALFFSIGLMTPSRAEETIVLRKKAGPDAFGYAVDVSGNTLIVGAPDKDNGEVYIFVRQGDAWIEQARIQPPQPNLGGWFGGAVCIDGDTTVVGARSVFSHPHVPADGSGVVYLYEREGKKFLLKQRLRPKNLKGAQLFGFAVDLSGDTLVVGAPWGDGPGVGRVYAYVRGEQEFQLQRIFFGDGGQDAFGWSVAIDRDTIVVGIPFQDMFVREDGTARIYVREGKYWEQEAWIWAKDGSGREHFGWSVAISGDRVITGAPNTGGDTPGAAYIFRRNEDEWTQELRLNASKKEIGANFGFAVDIDINRAVVAAPFEDSTGKDAGVLYSFLREGDTWVEKARFTPKGVIQGEPHKIWEGDVYGSSVAIARKGPYAIVGAPGDNLRRFPPNPSGAVYVYDTAEDFLTPRPVELISLTATRLGDVKRTALLQNFPNPFNPETWIPYQLGVEAEVSISIYDVQGYRVRRIELGERAAGVYLDKETAAYWDGRSDDGELVSSGVYYYYLQAGDFHATRRMVIVK